MSMKKDRLLIFLSTLLLFICCKNNGSEAQLDPPALIGSDGLIIENLDSAYEYYADLFIKGSKSPVIENKLFSDFRIGMSEKEAEDVWKKMKEDGKLIHKDEAGEEYGTIITEYEDLKKTCVYVFWDFDDCYYLDIGPKFVNDSLVALECSIIPDKKTVHPDSAYIKLAKIFEKSDRGKEFKKYMLYQKNDEDTGSYSYIFLKDNLAVEFLSVAGQAMFVHYTNMPSVDALSKAFEEQSKQSKSSSDF